MNRKMVMLGTFLSASLLVANTLQLVSCKKKGQKVNDKNDNEKTAEQVEMETAVKLKTEIRNIIDEIVTNPTANEWIINLVDGFTDQYQVIVNSLNAAINQAGEKNKIELNHVSNLDKTLMEIVKMKFTSLDGLIFERIEKKATELGLTNFTFELDQESVLPMLTTLTGKQVLEAVNKLKKINNSSNTVSYLITSFLSADDNDSNNNDIKLFDLFKVTTDLKYNFSFGSKQYIDDYSNCELFLTEDSENFKKLDRFTQKTITDIIKNDEDIKKIQIYQGDYNFQENAPINKTLEYIQKFEYLGKQMDWDFSKQEVKDEIKQMQYDSIESSGKLRSIIDDLKFDINNFEFETLNYMKFNNDGLHFGPNYTEDCILVCKHDLMKKDDVLKKIERQYGLDENGSLKTGWDGGKLNKQFIEQTKQDVTSDKSKFDYSRYYGLGEFNDLLSDFLVGYGTTTIRKAYYADIPLSTLTFTTALTVPYDGAGMLDLYRNLKEYLGVIIDAAWNTGGEGNLKNNGIRLMKENEEGPSTIGSHYVIEWKFANVDEWETIEEKAKNSESEVTFDWIMEEVLYKNRILMNDKYKLPENNAILKEAKTSLKSKTSIYYEKHKSKNAFVIKKEKDWDFSNKLQIYVKYGPFIVFLTDDVSLSSWVYDYPAIIS